MKILNEKGSQEELKYEVYNMQLNQEKARRYREELAKEIQFFRLDFKDSYDTLCNGGLDLVDYIKRVGESSTKYIYEFTEIPKVEQSVSYGDFVDISLPTYHFCSYNDECVLYSEWLKENRKKYMAQQKEFLKQFIEEGLSNYNFKHVGRIENLMHAYIFLNSFDYRSKHNSYSCIDNVVWLPNELIAMYLLEKGYIEEAHYYINKIVDLKKERKLFANFEFEESSEFTQKQMRDLLNSGLLEEEALKRKLSLDLYVTNYIK